MSGAFYVTTPIYYVNAEPHIGHTYTTIVVDTLARYHRLAGDQTFFLTGSDEHGEKVAEVAQERGETPKAVADRYSGAFRGAWKELGFSYDRFIRTTDPDHVATVQEILQRVYDAGEIYFQEYEGLYCVGCERFLTERDMVDGLCRDHERAPERRNESNYFFRMSSHFKWLAEKMESEPDWIHPVGFRNEALAMLRDESGLGDLCISRPKDRLSWGIELPFDRDYVCYVWFDALVNYVTAIGYPDGPDFEQLWGSVEHVIGKDILKPHAIFWPIMLRVLDLPPFRHLHVHGHWLADERKVSKSLGTKISPLRLKERYGFEAARYVLLRDMVFGQDANFTEEGVVARINADLANNLGNLVSRTLNMTARYADGRVPERQAEDDLDAQVAAAAPRAAEKVDTHVRRCELHRALEAVFEFLDVVNRFLETRAPWQAAKSDDEASRRLVAGTLYTSCEALRVAALLLAPFLPATAPVILERLGVPDALSKARLPDDAARWGVLKPGTPTTKGSALFPRLEAPGDA